MTEHRGDTRRLPLWLLTVTALALTIGGIVLLTGNPVGGAVLLLAPVGALCFYAIAVRRGQGRSVGSAVAGRNPQPRLAALGSMALAVWFFVLAFLSFRADRGLFAILWLAAAICLAYVGIRAAQLAVALHRYRARAGDRAQPGAVSYGRKLGLVGILRSVVIVAATERELVFFGAAFRQKPERKLPYVEIREFRVQSVQGRHAMRVVAPGRELRLTAMPSESLERLRRTVEARTSECS